MQRRCDDRHGVGCKYAVCADRIGILVVVSFRERVGWIDGSGEKLRRPLLEGGTIIAGVGNHTDQTAKGILELAIERLGGGNGVTHKPAEKKRERLEQG